MAVRALETSLPSHNFSNKILFADTSFVVALFHATETQHVLAKTFYDRCCKHGSIFCINVTVRQELLMYIRKFLVMEALKRLNVPSEIFALVDIRGLRFDLAKKLVSCGFLPFVSASVEGRIKKERLSAESAFFYETDSAKKLLWDNTVRLMELYGLNSSDAMILNFAIGHGCDGLVTFDSDFKVVDGIDGFDIFMPKNQIS